MFEMGESIMTSDIFPTDAKGFAAWLKGQRNLSDNVSALARMLLRGMQEAERLGEAGDPDGVVKAMNAKLRAAFVEKFWAAK
jgi:hypothetical protein